VSALAKTGQGETRFCYVAVRTTLTPEIEARLSGARERTRRDFGARHEGTSFRLAGRAHSLARFFQMAVRFDIKSLLMVGLLLGACGEDGAEGPSDEQEEEPINTGNKPDAGGTRKDASTGSTTRDAAVVDDDDDPVEEEPVEPDEPESNGTVDAGPSKPDAGSSKPDAGGTKADAGTGGACSALTYESFGKGFITTYCASCHSAGDFVLTSLANIKKFKADIKEQAVDSKRMPQKGAKQPTDAERAKLGQWLDCGPL
jgi:hypothetical protein